MAIKNLEALYLEQLKDLYSACKQSMPAVTEMGRTAQSPELAQALVAGNEGIARGIEHIADLCKAHDIDPTDAHCKGMEGLVWEARRHAVEEDFGDEDAQDAAIITQYQRLAHYAIAGYGSLRSFAHRLGFAEDTAILQECLDHTWNGDRRMTQIAEGGVNEAAMDGK